jgi:hypothetical protein
MSQTGRTNPLICGPFSSAQQTPYSICVRRGWKPLEFEYYRIPLRERLPAIAIALRQSDPDVPLDLQALIDQCYETARYDDDIDYREEPDPHLKRDDAQWADTLLREQGRRELANIPIRTFRDSDRVRLMIRSNRTKITERRQRTIQSIHKDGCMLCPHRMRRPSEREDG